MARNKTLLSILQDYRAEIRASGNAAHNSGARENQVRMLQRTQEWLWEDFAWAHLRVERKLPLQAGQRYYDTPQDIPIDRLERVDVRYGEAWVRLAVGIDNSHLSAWDSDRDQRSWPVERWQVYEDDQIELWPVPADNGEAGGEGELRFTGIRALRPFVADDDRADLDDRLIILHAAAETLAAQGAPDAPLKLQAALRRRDHLVGNMSKIKSFRIYGGHGGEGKPLVGPPRVHYRDRETG